MRKSHFNFGKFEFRSYLSYYNCTKSILMTFQSQNNVMWALIYLRLKHGWSLMHDFGRAKGVINIAQSRKKGSAIIVATILHYIWYALVPNLVLKSLSYMVSLSYLVMPKVYWNNFRSSYWNWILSNLKFKWNIFFNFCRLLRISTFYIKKNWSAPDMLPICNIEMV